MRRAEVPGTAEGVVIDATQERFATVDLPSSDQCQWASTLVSGGAEVKTSKVVSIKPIPTPSNVEEPVSVEPQQSAVDFKEVLRLIGSGAVIGDTSSAVVFTERSELLMRQVVARYGFDRLPATYGELLGLFEYCDSLDAASGVGMRPQDQLSEWQAGSFVVWRRKDPDLMPAIELYCAGAIAGLRALHRQEDTLTTLGRKYLEIKD
jgi:hypothetical protein